MSILGKFTKQPSETLDYDVDYTDWFSNRADGPLSFTVVAEPGITVVASSRSNNIIRVVLSGGLNGESYKITVRVTTTGVPAIIKEADFIVRVKEV